MSSILHSVPPRSNYLQDNYLLAYKGITFEVNYYERKPGSEWCFTEMCELKGLELSARAKIAYVNGFWRVPSQSTSRSYKVNISPASCECEDFTLRKEPCKHILAARIGSQYKLGIEPAFWQEGKSEKARDVLPLVRPG